MKTWQMLLKVCVLIGLSASISYGADLATYQGKYADALKSIRADAGTNHELLVARYVTALQGVREKSQRNGELEELKAVLAEAKRFTEKNTVAVEDAAGSFPALKKIQTTFIREVDDQKRAESERICSLTEKYDRVLAQLQVDLTKEGKIDDASAVLVERKKLKTMIAAPVSTAGQMPKNEPSPAADVEIVRKPNAGSGSVTIKAFIDIQDVLKMQGNKIWYEHASGALPGKWADQNQPTFISKKAWMPVWESSISKPYEGIKPEISAGTARVRTITGRGKITILEQPVPENDYTLAVSLYVPVNTTKWYLPEKAAVARKTKPLLQKDPWGPQVGLQGRYESARAQSIWATADDQYVYLVSTVR